MSYPKESFFLKKTIIAGLDFPTLWNFGPLYRFNIIYFSLICFSFFLQITIFFFLIIIITVIKYIFELPWATLEVYLSVGWLVGLLWDFVGLCEKVTEGAGKKIICVVVTHDKFQKPSTIRDTSIFLEII